MTLHLDDNLVRYMFKLQPILNQELSRLHQLVSHFINEQYLLQKLRDDEDQQMKILKLMGTTLIPEENQFNGFMPLKSYLINKKEIKTGMMCPQDHEELIRALILKDALEKLDCTYEKFKDTDKIAKKKKKVVEEEKKQEDDIFA